MSRCGEYYFPGERGFDTDMEMIFQPTFVPHGIICVLSMFPFGFPIGKSRKILYNLIAAYIRMHHSLFAGD